jgi:hypothetical protein
MTSGPLLFLLYKNDLLFKCPGCKIGPRIKQLGSFRDFKQKLNLLLLDHPLYSLNEFFIFEEDN